VPGLPDDFVGPKEEEIIELCLQEKAQGRRVLLLCQQDEAASVVAGGNGHLNGDGHVNGNAQRPLLAPDRLIVTNGDNGRSPQQASLFTNGHSPIGNGHRQEKTNGDAVISTLLNGKQAKHDESNEAHESADLHKIAPPPVPRPRLFFH